MFATLGRTAGISGARIPIITFQGRSREADTVPTHVRESASIAITARPRSWGVLATGSRLAGICGADVFIAAIEGSPSPTHAGDTSGTVGTCILIVTGEALVQGNESALARGGSTDRFQAATIFAWCGRTLHHRGWFHLAEELDPALVTIEGAIAEVAIFQLPAIRILFALAFHGGS
jgi:hypothetical protein